MEYLEKMEGKFWGMTVAPVQSSCTGRVRLACFAFRDLEVEDD